MAALTLLTTSCANLHVQVDDFQACADIGTQGATCDNFLSSAPADIDKDRWDDLRFGQLCISGDAYADVKREIEELCSTGSVTCDYETRKTMHAIFARLDRLTRKH